MGLNTDVSAEMVRVDDHGQHYEVNLTVKLLISKLFMLPILTVFFKLFYNFNS